MITRDNYESFFLDYKEGNLKENRIDEFLDFLEQNPDLKEELYQFENIDLPEEQILFSEKEKLYKSAANHDMVPENKLIAYLEGDLEKKERLAFETCLAGNPELQKEYKLFVKTRLNPDPGIRFTAKQKLYRKPGYVVVMNWAVRAAAVVILIWGINSLYQNRLQPQHQIADQALADLNPKVATPETKTVSEKEVQERKVQGKPKPVKASKHTAPTDFRPQKEVSLAVLTAQNSSTDNRDLTAIAAILPRLVQLQPELPGNQLAYAKPLPVVKINNHRKEMTIEEFLADRAKKVGNEGLLSAERLARVGLGVASELSGKRIGYTETNGKITSLNFESKLLAFSIPLKK